MSRSARPRRPTDSNSYSVAILARNALSTMEIFLALSSARRYEVNWNRFAEFLPTLDRKRHYLPGSPNTIIIFVQHFKEEGKAPSTIRTYLSSRKAQSLSLPYPHCGLFVLKTVKRVARSRPHVDQRQPTSSCVGPSFFAMLISCQFKKLHLLSI